MFWDKIVAWLHAIRLKYVEKKAYVIFVSIIIGIFSALAAVMLKNIVYYIKILLQYDWGISYLSILYFIYPLVGIFIVYIYLRVFHDGHINKEIGYLIYKLSRNENDLPRRQIYAHLITSGTTVGFGGSVGLEAPIVLSGSSIGSAISKYFRVNLTDRNLLIACGAAGGISAIFNAPIEATIFAFEVLLPSMAVSAFVPLLISSATASIFSNLLFAEKPFVLITNAWEVNDLTFYIVFGVLCGLLASYMIKMSYWIGRMIFRNIKSQVSRLIIGSILLGSMIFIFPALYGEGYDMVNALFVNNVNLVIISPLFQSLPTNTWIILIAITIILLIKVIATSLTLGAGGNGGIFAPSLFTGAFAGYAFATIINLTGVAHVNAICFMAVGMAGVFSGVLKAPMTAIFLIAEVTGGYSLFLPLMIVSALSYFIARYIEPHSVYTKMLAEDKKWDHEKIDSVMLQRLSIKDLIETNFTCITIDDSLFSIREKVFSSSHKFFPVVDKDLHLTGIVHFNDIKNFFLNKHEEDFGWEMLIKPVKDKIEINDSVEEALKKLENVGAWNLPVTDNGIYKGFLFRSRILDSYRQHVIQQRTMF